MASTQNIPHKAISIWLFGCCGVLLLLLVVGAITRLTDSGLSIVEWKPILGAIPPLNDKDWETVFALYKASPEFHRQHFWMEMQDFKFIYFWEWLHRFLGRVLGLVYFLPLLIFLYNRWIPKGDILPLFAIFVLGGAQGFMGWYMVKSGLVDRPDVSHFRLAAHLGLALLIYSLMFLYGLRFRRLLKSSDVLPDRGLFFHCLAALVLLALTICWGAFTAGLDAGLVCNESFPKMCGQWIPDEIVGPSWFRAIIHGYEGVQFVHRWLAIVTVLMVLTVCFHAYFKGRPEKYFLALGVMVFLQAALGLVTLLSSVALLPAVLHQFGAVILLSLLLVCFYRTKRHA